MLTIGRHAWLRAWAVLTSPGDLALLVFAAWSSFFAWFFIFVSGYRLTGPMTGPARPAFLGFVVVTLWFWPWAVARPLQGRSTGGDAPPLPALPISWFRRALAEAVTGLLLVLAIRALTVTILTGRLFGLEEPASWGLAAQGGDGLLGPLFEFIVVSSRVAHGAAVSLLVLPVLLAWSAPVRSQGVLLARSLLVATLGGCLPAILAEAPDLQPLHVILAIAAGTLLLSVLATTSFESARRRKPQFFRSGPGPLTRPGLEPARRFRRDRWEPHLRSLRWFVAPAFALLVGGSLLFVYTTRWRIAYPLCIGLAVGLLTRFYAAPLGADVFATDLHAGSASPQGGAYVRAWARLPVPPEAVVRAVYLHGLASASIVWLLWAGHELVAVALGHWRWHAQLNLPLLLGIPVAAGLLLCTSVGDHFKRTLSALALASFLPAHFAALTLPSALTGVEWSPRSIAALDLGVLVSLSVIGGLPPLVHLRGRETIPEHQPG
jgi:hypothetical protein